jgi:hypothetical protein
VPVKFPTLGLVIWACIISIFLSCRDNCVSMDANEFTKSFLLGQIEFNLPKLWLISLNWTDALDSISIPVFVLLISSLNLVLIWAKLDCSFALFWLIISFNSANLVLSWAKLDCSFALFWLITSFNSDNLVLIGPKPDIVFISRSINASCNSLNSFL